MQIKKCEQEIIKFGVWLTGHEQKDIEQMLNDYNNYKDNKSNLVEARVSPKTAEEVLKEFYNIEYLGDSERTLEDLEIVKFMLARPQSIPPKDNCEPIKPENERAFYVKVKIQSKENLELIFVTDHLVFLPKLTTIDEAVTEVKEIIERRLIELEDDKYSILSFEKIMFAMDNPRHI